jgi:hypothetical protein
MAYLIDTDIVIDHLEQLPDATALLERLLLRPSRLNTI